MNKRYVCQTLLVPALAFITLFAASPAVAQAPTPEEPKLKDFGSSLKQLKWDPDRNAAVETKSAVDRAKNPDEDDVVRVETLLIVCDVLVIDRRGRTVLGLTEKDFVVTEDGKPQQVALFSAGDNATIPRSIVLLIDYSPSQVPFLKNSIEAAKTLVDKLGPLDRMAIVTDDVELLQEFTSDKQQLKASLESLISRTTGTVKRFGRSAQYSALMATLKEAFDSEDQRPIVIFQTDGDEAFYLRNPVVGPYIPPITRPKRLPPEILARWQQRAQDNLALKQQYQRDNVREFSLSDVYRAAETSRATIYTVVPGFGLIGRSPDKQINPVIADKVQRLRATSLEINARMNQEEAWKRKPRASFRSLAERTLKVQSGLDEVARSTGGWTAFLEKPSLADEIYSQIFSDINLRYILGYYPTNKERNGKRRRVSVEVRDHPEYEVLGRKAYYAPDDQQP